MGRPVLPDKHHPMTYGLLDRIDGEISEGQIGAAISRLATILKKVMKTQDAIIDHAKYMSECQHDWEWACTGEFKVCLKCQITEWKDGRQEQTVWCVCAEPDVVLRQGIGLAIRVCRKCGKPIKEHA